MIPPGFFSVVVCVILGLSLHACYRGTNLGGDGRIDVSMDLSEDEATLVEDTEVDLEIDQHDLLPDHPDGVPDSPWVDTLCEGE
jgi:hypothetical protein